MHVTRLLLRIFTLNLFIRILILNSSCEYYGMDNISINSVDLHYFLSLFLSCHNAETTRQF